MSRRRRAEKREIDPDPFYGSTVLAKFINKVMERGKKSDCPPHCLQCSGKICQGIKAENPLKLLNKLWKMPSLLWKLNPAVSAAPPIKCLSKFLLIAVFRWRCDGSSPTHAQKQAVRWKMALAAELADCFNNQGTTIKKKDDTHRMAEANKAFAHYKW